MSARVGPACLLIPPLRPPFQKRSTLKFSLERIIGNGSFGTVFEAKIIETGETVAIKKVLQDRRFKNRELQIMKTLHHGNVVQLKHCFFTTEDDVRWLPCVVAATS